ncbi:MAG TPA: DinB family protein [Bryobacteraceae bacterium]|nr:DinB family protein [Bryobacteraceae bacterium]
MSDKRTPGSIRPEENEIASYAKIYVDCVPPGDVVQTLADQIAKTIALVESIGERGGDVAYAPGKWTVKQVIGHMIDCERIFSYRALRIARGDTTPLPGFEQNDYVPSAESEKRKLSDLLQELALVRQSTLALVRSLPEAAWARRGIVSNFSLTVRGIVFTAAGHELHHYRIFRERYLPAVQTA